MKNYDGIKKLRSKENKQEIGMESENKNTEGTERRNKWSNRKKGGRKEQGSISKGKDK